MNKLTSVSVMVAGFLIALSIVVSGGLRGPMGPKGDTGDVLSAQSVNVTDGNCLISPNGGRLCTVARAMTPGTTTPFAVTMTATSTVVQNMSYCEDTVGTTTATQWTWAKAANPFATTTLLSYSTLASAKTGVIMSTTTGAVNSNVANAGVDPALMVPAGQSVVVGIAGIVAPAGLISQGRCQLVYTESRN